MRLDIKAYMCPEGDSEEIRSFESLMSSIEQYGVTPGLEMLILQNGSLSGVYREHSRLLLAMEASTALTTIDAKKQAAGAAGAAGTKNLVGKILEKIGNFLKYLGEKLSSFIASLTNRVAHSRPSMTAKAIPFDSAAKVIEAVPKTTQAVTTITAATNALVQSPTKDTGPLMGQVSKAITVIDTGGFKLVPYKNGDKVGFKRQGAAEAYAKVTASMGKWNKSSLGTLVSRFSTYAHGLWNAVKSFLGSIKNMATSILKGGFSVTKHPIRGGDKLAAGAIGKLQNVAAKGGIKGIVAGIGSMMIITYLVNTVLKIIKASMNYVSGVIHDTVDAICGPEQ